MKKLITFFTTLCLCLLMVPTTVEAKETTSEYFTIDLDVGEHNYIAPGDSFTETFQIKNTAKNDITVHLYDVENVDNSKLYSVMKARFDEVGESLQMTTLEELKTNWYTIKPNQTLELDLDMNFPSESGNEYQGATLKARFTFEARIDTPIENAGAGGTASPKTGDTSNILLWTKIAALSGSAALVSLLVMRKKKTMT